MAAVAVLAASSGVAAGSADGTNAARGNAIPFKGGEDALSTNAIWRVAVGFGLALGAGVGGIYLLRRFLPQSLRQARGHHGRIRLLETRRLTPRLTLFLVEVDGRVLLLSQSGESVQQIVTAHGESVQAGNDQTA